MRPTVYLQRLDRADGLDVWRVDGHRIRDALDVEFTNAHHDLSRKYIPRGEVWLDRDADGSEWELWLYQQLRERARLIAGAPFLTALVSGQIAARKERRRLAGPRPEPWDPRLRRLGDVNGRAVWVVDGRMVRDHAYIDFTLGGHGYRYRFIPKSEIWLDDAVRPSERPAILRHEAVEVALMARGMRYQAAHARASAAEATFRRSSRARSS